MKDVVAIVLAGGRGERLSPLTNDRTKPAVYFGGIYRIIDITLSNCVNSEIFRIYVFPQYKAQSLVNHLEDGWNIFNRSLGHYVRIAPPQMRVGNQWYQGTADSIRQNLYILENTNATHFLILSGDHIYKMNYELLRRYHEDQKADISVSAIEVDPVSAHRFGVLDVDDDYRINGFVEKPENQDQVPKKDGKALVSMGIYLFRKEVLVDIMKTQEGDDFGKHIIPEVIGKYNVVAYPYQKHNRIRDFGYKHYPDGSREQFIDDCVPDSFYWRDVGDLDSFWNANMDLTGSTPQFNLYSVLWPLRNVPKSYPPVKTIFHDTENSRIGSIYDSIVAPGTIISGGEVSGSVVSYNVRVNSWAMVHKSVVFPHCDIGRYCRIRNTIIDRNNRIPAGTSIGFNLEEDKNRFTVTDNGIVVVPKDYFPMEQRLML